MTQNFSVKPEELEELENLHRGAEPKLLPNFLLKLLVAMKFILIYLNVFLIKIFYVPTMNFMGLPISISLPISNQQLTTHVVGVTGDYSPTVVTSVIVH